MDVTKLKNKILSGGFDGDFIKLYGETENSRSRYAGACDKFLEYFKTGDDMMLFSAPGRTEVGGNHTDHQHGRVLAGSVNLDVIAVACKNSDNVVRIKSAGYPMDEIRLDSLDIDPAETGRAASLIRGMCAFIKEKGFEFGGFDAYTTSNVLKGSGLSSSAAFEVLIGNIISGLFGCDIPAVEIAKIAQKAENVYFGKPSGLMDQMASSVGGFTGIDFKDTDNPVIERVDFDLKAQKHSLCIINTGGNHADLTSDYAAITDDCKKISGYFGAGYLREVEEAAFYDKIGALRAEFGDRAVLRAIHFFDDNKRALLEKEALKNGDFSEFLRLINESGNSSYKYLQNVFSVGAPNEQGLSLALCLTEKYLNGRGACRVHGGGFAGTIQCFVPDDMLDGYKAMIEKVFGAGSCYVLNIRPIGGHVLEGE